MARVQPDGEFMTTIAQRNRFLRVVKAAGAIIIAALTLAPCVFAGSQYTVLNKFNDANGASSQAALIFDSTGNLYGTTTYGGDTQYCSGQGCGTVFKLTPGSAGWTETVLHNFHGKDGSNPVASLIFDGAGNLYGTTANGGDLQVNHGQGCGTVFKITPGGNGKWTETVLHFFHCGDGANPVAGLIFDRSGNVYGTTTGGGNSICVGGCGTVYELKPRTDGKWTETVLHRFRGDGGRNPLSGVIFDAGGNLYSTTDAGGDRRCNGGYGCGTVFKLAAGAWNLTILHEFHDGRSPDGVVFDNAGNLYGITTAGGNLRSCNRNGCGTVFELVPSNNGEWNLTVLHSFQGKDGANPSSTLIFDAAGNLYGTTQLGGDLSCSGGSGCGTVFKLAPDSNNRWTEKVLHSFRGPDGNNPTSALTFDAAGNLYSTTATGGNLSGCSGNGCGVIFEITQ
jgi:uncharacterized repeat protein (TIGR03803 family)